MGEFIVNSRYVGRVILTQIGWTRLISIVELCCKNLNVIGLIVADSK